MRYSLDGDAGYLSLSVGSSVLRDGHVSYMYMLLSTPILVRRHTVRESAFFTQYPLITK